MIDRSCLPSIPYDVHFIAPRLREKDQLEVTDWGMTPAHALRTAIRVGPCYTLLCDGTPKGMFGCHTGQRTVWSLFTGDLTLGDKRYILQQTPGWLAAFLEKTINDRPLRALPPESVRLWNYIRKDNADAIQWLERSRCFEINKGREITIGPGQYYRFRSLTLPEVRAIIDGQEGTPADV